MILLLHGKMNQQQIQQCIRQDAEERNEALSDLTAWMDTLKVDKSSIPSNKDQDVIVSEGTYEEEHERGNAAFRKGEYAEAVECYSRCLKHDEGQTPDIYSNLSLAYLKTKHWSKAEHAATAALRLSPCHSKSLHRRSVANLRQGKLRAALVDVCVACDVVTGGQKEEITALKFKIEHALVDATKKAPRRRVTISFV